MSELNTLGPYHLLRTLGEGGMGTVYLAHDPALARNVAIKILRTHDLPPSSQSHMTKRFLREARAIAKLNHPHVVTIHAIAQSEGAPARPYLVMEYLDGGSLADHLRKHGPLPWQLATRAIRDALSALIAAHDAHIIHRDLKPANLMQTKDNHIKLVDFGLAHVALDPTDPELTFPGAFLGSPSYASPEQAAGALHLDPRSDLYSLAATWFTLIAGQPPYIDDDPAEVMRQHLTQRFPDLRTFAPVPTQLLEILEHASRHDPNDRYKSATEMHAAITHLLATEQSSPNHIPHSPDPRPSAAPATARLEHTIHSLESQLSADPPTRLAALRSLFGLYTQLDRRDDATKVFREALALHIKMQSPRSN